MNTPPIAQIPRLEAVSPSTNPCDGKVRWNPIKSLWFSLHLALALILGPLLFTPDAFLVFAVLTALTLCLGHSVGLHRLLIHRSFHCPLWLERILVHLGVLVGMGGPFSMMKLHDLRDWAQRHRGCHPFFIHQNPIWKDAWWNLHCDLNLEHPPHFQPDERVRSDRYYRFLERTWRWQQLPLGILLFLLGGWPWVIWGICARIPLSLTGHWFIGYLAHNEGRPRAWHLEGHAVQGYNVPGFGLLTMGEAWHNNHHAFPESARLGLDRGQADPGWWTIRLLAALGLAHQIRLPENLPARPERKHLPTPPGKTAARPARSSLPRLLSPRPLKRENGRLEFPETISHLTVFYDGSCALCATFAETIGRQTHRYSLDFVPYQDPRALEIFPPLDRFHPEREMLSLSREGDLFRGAESWVMCLYATEEFLPLARRLAHPRLLPLAKKAAILVGSHRHQLSRLLLTRKASRLARKLDRLPASTDCADGSCKLRPLET